MLGCVRELNADGVLVRVGQLCDIVAWEREEVGVSVALRCVGRVEITGDERESQHVGVSRMVAGGGGGAQVGRFIQRDTRTKGAREGREREERERKRGEKERREREEREREREREREP